MRGAVLISLLLHALLVLAFVEVSRERQDALLPAIEQAEHPEQPPVEVEVLADPRSGHPEGEDNVAADQPPTPAGATLTETPAVEPPSPAPAQPSPAAQADLPPPAPPEPPKQPATDAARPSPAQQAIRPPAPERPSPPPRVRAGSGTEGRDDGTTDIILGANTVPAGQDPSTYNIPPRYPREAAMRGQQGIVRLSVVVATDGSALSVEVEQSSGYPLLDRAARDAVTKWRFRPATDGGVAVPSTIPVSLSFILEDRR